MVPPYLPAVRRASRCYAAIVSSLFALAACAQEEPGSLVRSAEAAACLEPPAGATPTVANGGSTAFTVDGEATGDHAAAGESFAWGIRCDEVVRIVTVTDADGGEWRLGYGWSEGGKDETPQVDLQPLSPVSFTFRDVDAGTPPSDGQPVGEASGFVLREAGRLAAAMDVGAAGPALLSEEDLPDVVVGEAEVTGSEPAGECGRRIARALRFVADTEALVEAVGYDTVRVEGQDMTVWALASWGWEDPVCAHVSGELSFSVWREP
jgi:hypothetical protein